MTRCLIRCTVIFTFVILLFNSVRMSRDETNKEVDIVSTIVQASKIAGENFTTDLVKNMLTCAGCNLLYHAIFHVHLSRKFLTDQPHGNIVEYCSLNPFHEWSKKMVLFMTFSPQTESMIGPMWMFFLYTYRMDEHMFNRQRMTDEVFKSIHEEAFEILSGKLKTHCPVMELWNGEQQTYEIYIADVINQANNVDVYLENVEKSYNYFDFAKFPMASLIDNKMFSDEKLTLSNLIKDTEFVDTLIDKFGLITDDGTLKKLLVTNYNTFLDPKTTLRAQLDALYTIHLYFFSMLKIMMLRLCVNHMECVKLCTFDVKDYVTIDLKPFYNRIIADKLKEFIKLLRLTDEDKLTQFSTLLDMLKGKNFGTTEMIKTKHTKGIELLNTLCNNLSMINNCCVTKSMVLSRKKIFEIARSLDIYLVGSRSTPCNETIMSAEIFIKYLKKKLSGIDFSLIYTFMLSAHAKTT